MVVLTIPICEGLGSGKGCSSNVITLGIEPGIIELVEVPIKFEVENVIVVVVVGMTMNEVVVGLTSCIDDEDFFFLLFFFDFILRLLRDDSTGISSAQVSCSNILFNFESSVLP